MSSLSVRFFNSFKSKYLNFFFYLFDCQVSCAEFPRLVGLDGLEPSTSRLSGARSSHLSYRPVFLRYFSSSILDDRRDSEPITRLRRVVGLLATFVYAIFQIDGCCRCFEKWWRWRDSNPWPPACRAGALPTELHPHIRVYLLPGLIEAWQLNNKIFPYNA